MSSPIDQNNSDTLVELTQDQIQLIENNRKRALEIRKSKEATTSKIAKISDSFKQKQLIDTGAGFYLDEEDLIEEQQIKIKEVPPVPVPDEQLICELCKKRYPHSFLSINYDLNVCDSCRTENPDKYELITRTDAKEEFLLKDCDFDLREPPLKFMLKKNPRNTKWGDMKLYLKFQCRERAVTVFESEENLEEKKENKILNLHKTRQKNYEKKITELRKETRTKAKKLIQAHEHEYGEEQYDKKKDVNFKICTTCSYRLEYEEL